MWVIFDSTSSRTPGEGWKAVRFWFHDRGLSGPWLTYRCSSIVSGTRVGQPAIAPTQIGKHGRDGTHMALGLYFTPSSFSTAAYDDVITRLEAAGAGAPAGRIYHVALETDGQIQVFDVWDSQESFEAFGATLLPIMEEIGADPGAPHVSPVHNIIVG